MLNHYVIILLLLISTQPAFCLENKIHSNDPAPALVLDIEMLGDTSVESLKENDQALMKKFSVVLRDLLKKNAVFNVIDDDQSMALMNKKAEKQFLHRCNGCEMDLAKEVGAKFVIAPWIFRMSILIQTLVIEVRDVATGRLVLKSPYNFRGNIDKAWQNTILYAVKDLKKTLDNKPLIAKD